MIGDRQRQDRYIKTVGNTIYKERFDKHTLIFGFIFGLIIGHAAGISAPSPPWIGDTRRKAARPKINDQIQINAIEITFRNNHD